MSLQFTLAPEPDFEAREKGRLMFAGKVDFVKGVVAMSGLPPADRLEVCFAGRSNVGKSSLINALCGRKNLAVPGATSAQRWRCAGLASCPQAFKPLCQSPHSLAAMTVWATSEAR